MVQDLVKIERSLISVFYKIDLDKLVSGLFDINPEIEIISSGGTARAIKEAGYPVMEVSDYTGFPESPGGLLKTINPLVEGGFLLDPEIEEHKDYMEKNGIKPFDLVVVNLYPFEEAVSKGANIEEAREMIDIGGPTMIRAAAKGYKRVTVVVDPSDYNLLLDEMKRNNGCTSLGTRYDLAKKVFHRTGGYDTAISDYMHKNPAPGVVSFYLRPYQG